MKVRSLKALAALLFSGMLCSQNALARDMILDTDVGVDDAIAMLYLLNNPNVQIKAITIASDGSAHCLPAKRNTLGILKLVNKTGIPVACGRLQPMDGAHQFMPAVLKESDTLGGAARLLPRVEASTSQSAVNLLIQTLQGAAEPMDIVAIGPLTNIAEALQVEPDIKSKIHRLYVMGGAVAAPGNIHAANPKLDNQVAEWNIYIDPVAADSVFHSGVPITLIPLDVTNQAPITANFYERLQQRPQQGVTAAFANELFKHTQVMSPSAAWYFWDPLAAAIAVDDSLATTTNKKIRIVLEPESQAGATIVDDRYGTSVRVCTQVDQKRFETQLLKTLS